MPAASAAAGFSPTERIRNPIIVDDSHQLTTKKIRTVKYTTASCMKKIRPMIGISESGQITRLPNPCDLLVLPVGYGSDQAGETLAEKHNGKPGNHLIDAQHDDQTGEHQRHDAGGHHGHDQRHRRIAAKRETGADAGERADQHQSLGS